MRKYFLIFFLVTSAHAGPPLIGGQAATKSEFKSTINVEGCTGSKIGPKAFLFAAHCFVDTSSGEVARSFKTGALLSIGTHYNATYVVKVHKSFPHPTYVEEIKRRLSLNLVTTGGGLVSYDIGVFTVEEETPEIPVAELNYEPVAEKEEIVIGGYGCTTNIFSYGGGTYKIKHTQVVGKDSVSTDYYERDISLANKFNFYSAGQELDKKAASICPGDSGGPVYRENSGEVIGVNSQYIFKDGSGISTVNTHTRVSGVANWLQEILMTKIK